MSAARLIILAAAVGAFASVAPAAPPPVEYLQVAQVDIPEPSSLPTVTPSRTTQTPSRTTQPSNTGTGGGSATTSTGGSSSTRMTAPRMTTTRMPTAVPSKMARPTTTGVARPGVAATGTAAAAGQAGVPDVLARDIGVVAEASNRFAFNLHGRLQGRGGSLVYSPQVVGASLAMMLAGARGETARQIAAVLRLPAGRAARTQWLHDVYANQVAYLRPNGKARGYDLRLADALWSQKGCTFLDAFLHVLRTDYAADLREADFADADAARTAVNAWAARQTADRVQDLLPPAVLTGRTRLVLTSAVAFRGDWVRPFAKSDTADGGFAVESDRTVAAPLMRQTERFLYLDTGAVQVVAMPYTGAALEMLVFLPRKVDGLPEAERMLASDAMDKWMADLRFREVEIALPRFKATASMLLADALAEMGMPLAFDPEKADFSGALVEPGERVWLGQVVHKACVEVSEEGTGPAPGAILITGAVKEPPAVFRADHPFLFLVRDIRTGAILFVGRVTDPQT